MSAFGFTNKFVLVQRTILMTEKLYAILKECGNRTFHFLNTAIKNVYCCLTHGGAKKHILFVVIILGKGCHHYRNGLNNRLSRISELEETERNIHCNTPRELFCEVITRAHALIPDNQ